MSRMFILLVLQVIAGCMPSERKSESRITAAVEENLNHRKAIHDRQCMTTAIEMAAQIVDSVLLEKAHSAWYDPSKAPLRPERPEVAPPEITPDTTPLSPVIRPKRKGE